MHTPGKGDLRVLHPGRGASDQWPADPGRARWRTCRRRCGARAAPPLPEVSELEVVRHFTRLSQLNFSIDTHFYPLGSCTMKYNPKACNQYAMLPQFLAPPSARPRRLRPGLPRVHVRAAGDAQGSDRHARGGLESDGRCAWGVRRRGHDPCLPPLARGAAPPRDHRPGGRPRHQSGHGDHVRLRRAGDPGRCRRGTSISPRSRPPWVRTPPASCSPTPPRSGCSSGTSRRWRASSTQAGGPACTTTART